MTPERLRALLAEVAAGAATVEDAERRLAWEPFEELGFASVDHHRALRQGYPEVVFGQGKTPEQVTAIAERIAARGDGFLATRLAPDAAETLAAKIPGIELNTLGRTAWLAPREPISRRVRGSVLVVTAGTSDLPVAEEAAVTAAAFGNPVERLTDVGVAGIHRLLSRTERLRSAAVVIVVAGMEGALPSVVGGLVSVPVIAVPTSVGYGASFGGIAALLGMLNSCASGVTVVNIDNGFGAAAAASRINLLPPS
ncbi:MAG TPA: nickel pincer cofactor biosynthesis protein LarB [Longimicrobium sp.]